LWRLGLCFSEPENEVEVRIRYFVDFGTPIPKSMEKEVSFGVCRN
jgi:hypothetical protein